MKRKQVAKNKGIEAENTRRTKETQEIRSEGEKHWEKEKKTKGERERKGGKPVDIDGCLC